MKVRIEEHGPTMEAEDRAMMRIYLVTDGSNPALLSWLRSAMISHVRERMRRFTKDLRGGWSVDCDVAEDDGMRVEYVGFATRTAPINTVMAQQIAYAAAELASYAPFYRVTIPALLSRTGQPLELVTSGTHGGTYTDGDGYISVGPVTNNWGGTPCDPYVELRTSSGTVMEVFVEEVTGDARGLKWL
jgi:hypothetical protein